MWFYKILLGFYWVSPSFTEFYWILPGFTWFQWVHLLLMGFYWIRNPFSFAWKRFYRVFSCDWLRPSLPSAVPGWFIDNSLIKVIYFSSVSLGWYQIIVVFYWVFSRVWLVWPELTWALYRVWLVITGFLLCLIDSSEVMLAVCDGSVSGLRRPARWIRRTPFDFVARLKIIKSSMSFDVPSS